MSHFKQERDVEGLEAFIENLKKAEDKLEVNVFESMTGKYAAAGKTNQSIPR
ncbi:hypothetical protein MKW92_001200 [Papaver armeniacum]|nr:hypothetical protein MKW92_001200 [Papaver armeniacum]